MLLTRSAVALIVLLLALAVASCAPVRVTEYKDFGPSLAMEEFFQGKLTALRFLEWVQQNPEGVVSLPTGKTPEYFIRWVTEYLGVKEVANPDAHTGDSSNNC